MPDDSAQDDAEIIRAAYAERVKDAFKVFAENLAVGQSEKSCQERFIRSLQLVRKVRDLALQAAGGAVLVEPQAQSAEAAKRAGSEESAGEPLSAEDQALIEQALSQTTGLRAIRHR